MSYQSNYPPGVTDRDIDVDAGAVCPLCDCEYAEEPCLECLECVECVDSGGGDSDTDAYCACCGSTGWVTACGCA